MFGFFKKLGYFVTHPTSSRTIGILAILVIAASVPLTVFIAQKQQELRQRAAGNEECTLGVYNNADCTGDPQSSAPTSGSAQPCTPLPDETETGEILYRKVVCIAITPPLTPTLTPEVTLRANKTTVNSGDTVFLTWVRNVGTPITCTASSEPSHKDWNNDNPVASILVKEGGNPHGVRGLTETTTFTLTCYYGDEKKVTSMATSQIRVAVAIAAPIPTAQQPPAAQPPAQTSTNLFAVGDANRDGYIEIDDNDKCKNSFLKRETISDCDFNKDGQVNVVDYGIWYYSYQHKVSRRP